METFTDDLVVGGVVTLLNDIFIRVDKPTVPLRSLMSIWPVLAFHVVSSLWQVAGDSQTADGCSVLKRHPDGSMKRTTPP